MIKICGVGGLISLVPIGDDEAVKLLTMFMLLENEGNDAAGFFDGNKVSKFPATPSVMVDLHDNNFTGFDLYDRFLKKPMILLHNRAATSGDFSENKNNHPFETKDFVFAHNGVISEYSMAGKIDPDEPETDSWSFIKRVQNIYDRNSDVVKALSEAVSETCGQITFWLYDKGSSNVYFYNDNNRLYYAQKKNQFWFASLAKYLEKSGVEAKQVLRFKQNRLYMFDAGEAQLRNVCFIGHDNSAFITYSDYEYGSNDFLWNSSEKDARNDRVMLQEWSDPIKPKEKSVPPIIPDGISAKMEFYGFELSFASAEGVFIKFSPSYCDVLEDAVLDLEIGAEVTDTILWLPRLTWKIAILQIFNYLAR